MGNYKITPEQATNGTFGIQSNAHTPFEGAVQQETTDNSYGKAISNAASGFNNWLHKDPSQATVDTNSLNALAQTDVTPEQSENFVNKASEILQPAMHRAEQIYLWNKEDWSRSAIDSGEKLGINPDLIMASGQEGIRRAELAAAQMDRGKTIQEIRNMYPELNTINYKSSAEAITALRNLESINNTHGVFDAVQQNVWSMNDQILRAQAGYKLSQENDPNKIAELTAEINRLDENLSKYRQADGSSILEAVIGETAAQGYMMAVHAIKGSNRAAEGMALGATAGAVATAPVGGEGAIPGALVGLKTGTQVGMAEQMYQMSFGSKYLELINKKDASGNRVYSNEEAKEYAMSFAAIDAGIEFVATRAIGKAASKIAPKSALANAVSRGTTNAAETFNRGIGVTAAQVAKTSIKAGAPELFEEGLQDVNEKLQHNLWRKSNDQEGSYSVGDMFVGAGEAMWQALPAVVGFGVIGGGISGARTMKAFKDFQKLSPEEQHMAVMEEQNRNGHVIMQNLKNDAAANKLAKENPELYGKIVQAQGDNIGVSTAYVNVNEMAETEEGQAAIRNMVDAGLTTQEEVSKAITADAPIEIPIGSYAQLSGGLSEETVKALEESSYFTRGGLSMKTLERAKEEVHAMKDLVKDDTEKRAERVKNDIIRSYFDETSDVDKEMLDVVLADPTHIKQTFNNVYKKLTEQYREQYTSDFNAMDTDLETARTSGVNPIWLGDNKPPRSNSERRRMAYQSSLARTQNALADNPEALNQAGAHYADMEHTLKQIESLESMRDKLFELADNDIALRMQLSKSGYEVYQSLKSIMSDASVDRKQRDTAEANALLMAQHADIMADIMRRAGRGNYTAMDYFNTVRIDMKGELKGQKGLNQVKQSDVKLAKDQAEWVHTLKEYNPKSNAFVKIMDTPLVLQMIGGLDYDVVIKQSKIADIQVKHPEITLNEMEQLPFALADPVAIFKSSTVKDSIVVMAEMKADNGLNVVIPMQLNKTKRNNTIVYSLVNSVYTKDTVKNKWYQDYLENPEFGTPLYINEQKVTNWYLAEGLSLPQAKYHISDFFDVSIPNEKDLDKLRKQHNYQYYQAAWHGSPYNFDTFDLGKVGEGYGAQVHGWGLYFAENEQVADIYKNLKGNRISDIKIGDDIYRIKKDVLINTKTRDEIHDFDNDAYFLREVFETYEGDVEDVKKQIQKELDDDYDADLDRALKLLNRKDVQVKVNDVKPTKFKVEIPDEHTLISETDQFDRQSELVQKGLKAIFEEQHPGKTFKDVYYEDNPRVYDMIVDLQKGYPKDFALRANKEGIEGIEFNTPQTGVAYVIFNDKAIQVIEKYNQSINGMTTINSPTDRLIQIFKTADRSTFLHEMGHVFFDDIKNLAEMENAPEQLVLDWNKLKEWSEWDDTEGADNTKAHERFARGWEAYLREGKAPTKGLQRVFRMFSKWLTRIYRAVTRLGGLPPKEIQDIMARMIATQEDIDAYTKEQALEQFESSKLFKQLDEAEQSKVQSHIADVGEMAKERVMKRYMKELESRPIKEWNDEKDSIQADIEKRLMEQYPIYKDHQRYNAFGKNALANTRYGTLKELEAAEREQTGFTFNEAVNQAMESAEQTFIEDNHIGKSNIEIAEEWLLSSDGQMKLTEEEAKIIKSQTNRDLAKNWELLDKLNRLDPNSESIESELEPIEKQIIDDSKKVAKELGAVSKELDSAQDRIEKLKAQLQERINNVRAIRDSGVGVISDYMNRAKQELGDLTLSQAIQYKKYQNQAIREGKRADRALAVNKLEEALQAKQLQLLNQARARIAFDNALRIKKLRTKLLDNLNRMTRPKNPIAIEPNMRYFYAHMAYQMGLTKYDGLEPVDGFNMNAVINALDPDADILGDQSITFLDPWIVQLFYGKTPMSFKNLTVSQLNTLEELMTGMYKNGRNAYEGSTILNDKGESITFDDAVDGILTEAIDIFGKVNGNVFNAQNNQTGLEAVAGLINKGNLSLLKVETFLRRLGPNAVKYIYDPISRATQEFNERKEVSMRRLAKDVSSVYGKRELFNIRNKHMYDVGELRNLTKEQVIALALNWGTERNRQRAMETAKVTEVEMEKAFQEILTDKDWEFIIRTWDHINSFFTERSKVQEELYGNPLKKEEGITFTIGGRTIVGQYYPIVYNPEVNASISDKEVEDIAKTMVSSNAILGTGMSATKSRLDVVKDKSLLLDFDVIPKTITESINHITMRKAVTDVNRLVANREFQNYIVEKFGMNSYQFLRTWVRDNWKDEAAKMDDVGKILMFLKHNATMAIMAGRASVAIQNALNIPVAVYRIGAGNVIRAVNHAGVGFYGHGTETYNNTRDFVMEQSIFMRERIQTLDKDLKKGLTIQGKGLRINDKNIGGYKFEKGAEIRDEINNMGFRLLTETDFALSIPVWKFAYDQKVAELQSKEGVSTEWINQQAIEAGDRAVRDIFGSGDVKDAASIQRSRNQWVQLFVPFYSYANTLYNIIAESWYISKDKGDWMPFARVLWWGIISQAIGMTIYKAMTNGDDDDPESIAKSFAEEFVQQGTMGIPLVRDIATMGMKFILGERPYNKGNTVMGLSIFEKLWDTGQAISSDNKDIVDVGRSLSQVSNRVTGFSDTVTDAFWTLLRAGLTDTDAKIEDVFMSIILDKRLKTKKEKKKK
nr:MAG TPA: crystallin beta/gamma motif-containing protein [Caudoviricetes sp.]